MRLIVLFVLAVVVMFGGAMVFGPHTPAPALPANLVGADDGWLTSARELGPFRTALYAASLIVPTLVLMLIVQFRLHLAGRDWLVRHGITNTWLLIAVYTCGLLLLLAVVMLPVDYLSLILRRRYGLSQEHFGSWFAREVLTFVIGLIPTLIAVEGFYLLIRFLPNRWWLWASLGYAALSIGLVYLQPLVITPLFYRQTPLADQALRVRIMQLGEHIGVPISEVYVIDASKQGSEGNAYFTGVGGATRVVLYDTLVNTYPPDEVLTVLAHELGHWHERHVWKGLLLSIIAAPLALAALHYGQRWLLAPWQVRNLADVAGLPVLLLLAALLSLATLPVQNALSRRWESAADRIAIAATDDHAAVARTFAHLARQNLSNPAPSPLIESLFSTHPALGRRVAQALSGR